MRFAPPRNPRDMFQLLAMYDRETGMDELIKRIDFDGVRSHHLSRAMLGASPASTDDILPADCFKQTLLGDAFRRGILRNLLDAFPEKRRVIFVHVPKCAGTDLSVALGRRFHTVIGTMDHPDSFSPEGLLLYLRDLVIAAPLVDTWFVRGHVPLRRYVSQNLIRPTDQIFTVVRDPIDILISSINYRLTRFSTDPEGRAADTRHWLKRLDLARFPEAPDQAQIVRLATRMLSDPGVIRPNILSASLGTGTTESAITYLTGSDIEVTDTSRYNRWLESRWGLTTQRANTSRRFITRDELDPGLKARIDRMVTEDEALYRRIVERLDASGKLSIRGRDMS